MVNWVKIAKMQKELDQVILNKFSLTSPQTTKNRVLALLVELAELANETRCFKYWSTKDSATQDIILEEYADGIHFFISLGNELKYDYGTKDLYELTANPNDDLTTVFVNNFTNVTKLYDEFNADNFEKSFIDYLSLGLKLGLNKEQVINFYIMKNKKNHDRQNNGY